MYRLILITLLFPFIINAEMKCAPGKCASGSSMSKTIPKIENNITNNALKKEQHKATVKQLFNVQTVKVKSIETAKINTNHGYIVAKESKIYDVTAWFSGYIEKLYVNTLYTKVEKNDALARIYSPEVYKAKQDYLHALKFSTKRPSANMLQSAKNKLSFLGVTKKEIQQIKATRNISQFTTLYAKNSGWIFEKNINQGSYIDKKKHLFRIVDLSKVWMEAKIFQNELKRIDQIQTYKVSVEGIEKKYSAKKELLYPLINSKESTLTLRLSIDNSDELLKPGMYAKLLSAPQKMTKRVIPRTAVIRKNNQWYVFLATEFLGEYEPVIITVKPLDTIYYEVLDGLDIGDEIVNNALFMMDSDAQINAIY